MFEFLLKYLTIVMGLQAFFPISFWRQPTEVFCGGGGGVLGGFAGFMPGRLCWGLFFNKVTGLGPAALLKERLWRGYKISEGTCSTEHLWKTASIFHSDVLKMHLAISYWLLVSCLFRRYVSPCGHTTLVLNGGFILCVYYFDSWWNW